MKIEKVNRNISLLSNSIREEFYPKHTVYFDDDKTKILSWFDPSNNYPEKTIQEIRTGTTLESILFEDLIYKTGSAFNANDPAFLKFINEDKVNLKGNNFKYIFKKVNDNINKLGNSFIEITTDENGSFIYFDYIQPQKCRLTTDGKVLIYPDWSNYNKKKAQKLPLYPNLKKFTKQGVVILKSVFHIKTEADGFDHYGINEKIAEALKLNEKEHRRNNWQLSQIKKGFKRDFFLVTDFALNEREKKKSDAAFAKVSGDDYAGGVENIEGENGKLVPAEGSYNFDFTKDDTSDQLFLKMGFPRSLIGIKSGGAFSVEQVESDYDQYLPKVEEQQTFIISEFKSVLDNFKYNTNDWNVINTPPSIVLQSYMPFMNDEQKAKVIDNKLLKYGIE